MAEPVPLRGQAAALAPSYEEASAEFQRARGWLGEVERRCAGPRGDETVEALQLTVSSCDSRLAQVADEVEKRLRTYLAYAAGEVLKDARADFDRAADALRSAVDRETRRG